MNVDIQTDILIIGGGIAGLWLLNRLSNEGYSALLLEHNELGSQQTIASQGMIHGGLKYALSGTLSDSSETIAAMPERWRQCLHDQGDVSLAQTQLLSDNFYLWSSSGLSSKLATFFASKATRGRINPVADDDKPAVFQSKKFRGKLYQLIDLVLDVPSLISNLQTNYADRIYKIDWNASHWHQKSDDTQELIIKNNDKVFSINCQRIVLTAGAGNEKLMSDLELSKPQMQRRPLQQVVMKTTYPHPLYGHCIGANPSPRLTVSTHPEADGRMAWYLGGDLATQGIDKEPEALIKEAQKELKRVLGWIDFENTEWSTVKVDRAEPKQNALVKPDDAFVTKASNQVIVGWPTKLTLAPRLADKVLQQLTSDNVQPLANTTSTLDLPQPLIAKLPWIGLT